MNLSYVYYICTCVYIEHIIFNSSLLILLCEPRASSALRWVCDWVQSGLVRPQCPAPPAPQRKGPTAPRQRPPPRTAALVPPAAAEAGAEWPRAVSPATGQAAPGTGKVFLKKHTHIFLKIYVFF